MNKKIYTCGKMTGLSYEEQIGWRNEFEQYLRSYCNVYGINNGAIIIKPPIYYGNCDSNSYREVQEWEINQVAASDILIVNLDGLESSIGSLIEIGVAHGVNCVSNKHIYIIGIGKLPDNMHSWIKNSFIHISPTVEDAAEYVAFYYLTV